MKTSLPAFNLISIYSNTRVVCTNTHLLLAFFLRQPCYFFAQLLHSRANNTTNQPTTRLKVKPATGSRLSVGYGTGRRTTGTTHAAQTAAGNALTANEAVRATAEAVSKGQTSKRRAATAATTRKQARVPEDS